MNRDEFRVTLDKLRKCDYSISLSRLQLQKYTDYTDATHAVLKWYYEDNYKSLAIQAGMGTGKTEITKHICANVDDYPNILYVTHRRTLSNNLMSRFGQYGFEMYMNENTNLKKAKRIICSIDSLPKLFEKRNNEQVRTRFNLVILDEIESLLAHFTSPHIKYPRRTFDTLKIICKHAKVIALDADYNIRGFEFLKSIGSVILIQNHYKRALKKFVLTDGEDTFLERITDDIIKERKIIVTCVCQICG